MVAAIYVRADSVYKSMAGVDAWDIDRRAELYAGPWPVVAHPPCRAWGSLRNFAKPRAGEKSLAFCALAAVQDFGGVLEHPARSSLWRAAGLPLPGRGEDEYGGWTLPVSQSWWGHRAEKATWLYIVGVDRLGVPDIPLKLGRAEKVVAQSRALSDGRRKRKGDPGWRGEIGRAERERTPEAFAVWLVDLARMCGR